VNTTYTTEGNFQNSKVHNNYFAITPSLSWKVNDKVDVNVKYELFDNKAQAEQNFSLMGTLSQFGYSGKKIWRMRASIIKNLMWDRGFIISERLC